MKNALVYILLVATLLPTVSSWGTLAYFQLNRTYIARVLCENRDKPQLHCDGQCYLAKKLKAQQDKQDKETTERVQNMPMVQLFCMDQCRFSFSGSLVEMYQAVAMSPYLERPYQSAVAGVFQPPRC